MQHSHKLKVFSQNTRCQIGHIYLLLHLQKYFAFCGVCTFHKRYLEDMLLDVPFSAEEMSAAVSKLKAAGPDGLMAEHFKVGGEVVGHLVIECPEHYCGIGGYSRCTEERGVSSY